jgi:hypothetical protein
MLRVVAALLVAVLASSAAAPFTCAGWQAAPADRMACCERADHDCDDQTAADACCGQQEQSHQPAPTLSPLALVTPLVLATLATPGPDLSALADAAFKRHESFAAPPLHAPPGSFDLPLRI